jgi:hypothetical protein
MTVVTDGRFGGVRGVRPLPKPSLSRLGKPTPRLKHLGPGYSFREQRSIQSDSPRPISTTTSGIVFLPARDEDYVHVFGIIATPWDDPHEDRLEGHAERRVQAFIDAQRDQFDWKGAIQDVFLWNESLTRPGGGFSPCASCCDSLATMWCPDGLKGRRLEWKEVYPGRGFKKENRTTKESLRLMEKAKPVPWGLTENHRPTT